MKTRKRMTTDPNTVLSNAIYMGLVALTRLARNRTNKKTRRYYRSIEKMWVKARADYEDQNPRYPDLTPVQKAEPNMRGQFLKSTYSSTRRYGNRETKRVYSWLEGSVGNLNSLLNYSGARLRDLAMTLYPFSEPEKFEVREYADGSKKILTPSQTKDSKGDPNAIKTYYKFGYERKRKLPRVFLSHPTLSGLDFVDMIRAHCVELCRQCFIYDVPMNEAHRYIRFLIHDLKPFLDWVYTGGRRGRNNFNPDADKVLRRIVLEIRALYKKRSKVRKRVSHRNGVILEPTIELVKEKAMAALKKTNDQQEKEALQDLLDHIDSEDIVVRDIEKLIDMAQGMNSREGNQWHKTLVSDLHHPASLKQVVYAGDRMLDEPSSILIVAELPVARYAGKVDLTVFIRRRVAERILWTPVMVLEIKTKTGFDFNLFGMNIKRKRSRTVTPAFYTWKRTLSKDEWNSIITSKPDGSALAQLNEYSNELVDEYRQVAPHDPRPPSSLWKGVIVLDTEQVPADVFPAFQFLLEDLTTGLLQQLITQEPVSITPEPLGTGCSAPRVCLLIAPTEGPAQLLDEMESILMLPEEDPFAEREVDDRTLTLYIPIDSSTSSGKTAARISTNWHLLHHIRECIEVSSEPTDAIWLDLTGDYRDKELVEKRFGIRRLYQEKKISRDIHDQLSNTLQDIKFINLSGLITRIFDNRPKAFDRLDQHLRFLLPSNKEGKRIIVLDGWAEIKQMIPKHQQNILRALELQLLETLPPSDVEIIWIDSETQHTRMNRFYQRKCIKPLRHDSPRRFHLDEVLYNAPTCPWTLGWTYPQQEDVRIIIQDYPVKVHPWHVPIHVPQLTGLALKFKGLSERKRTYSFDEVERFSDEPLRMYGRNVTLSSIYASTGRLSAESYSEVMRNALSLIPSVLRDRGAQPVEEETDEEATEEHAEEDVLWQSVPHTVGSNYGPSLKDRLEIEVLRPPPIPTRGEPQYTDADEITRGWDYERTPTQLFIDEDEQYISNSPPVVNELLGGLIDTLETRESELRRIQYATRYLKDQTFVPEGIRLQCRKIERFCAKQLAILREHPSVRTPEFFLESLNEIKELILRDVNTARVWKHLAPVRTQLVDLLNSENRDVMDEIIKRNADVLHLYGNNLFLAVLVVLGSRGLSVAERLWNSIAEWTFYQLGMENQDDKIRWVYSFQAILSSLRTYVKTFPIPKDSTRNQEVDQRQVGAIIWEESEYTFNAMLLIPREEGFITALIEGLRNTFISPKYHQCEIKTQRLRKFAHDALSSTDRTPLVSTEILGEQVLWIPLNDEDQDITWMSLCLERHGESSGRNDVVPYLILNETPLLEPPEVVPSIPISVDEVLMRIAGVKKKQVPVSVMLSVNRENETYKVNLFGENVDEYLEFSRTDELTRFLQYNIRFGSGYILNGQSLVWDRSQDIDYGDDLFFLRPLVHRSRFYPDEFYYPKTCSEYLSSTIEKGITMVIRHEGDSYRLELKDFARGHILRRLENVTFDVFAMGLLADCKELYDSKKEVWHPVELDVAPLVDAGFRFSRLQEYSRLYEALLAEEKNPERIESKIREAHQKHLEMMRERERELTEMYDGVSFSIKKIEYRHEFDAVKVYLESNTGDEVEETGVQNVLKLRKDTEYAGAIYPERVISQVTEALSLYGIGENDLEEIIKEVKGVLEEQKIRFFEEG